MCARRLTLVVVAIATAGFAGQAAALGAADPAARDNNRAPFYIGVGLGLFHIEFDGVAYAAPNDGEAPEPYAIEARPLALTLRFGWNPLDWLGVEAFAATGIHADPNKGKFYSAPDDSDISTGTTELKLAYGVALKPRYTFQFDEGDTTIDLYALIGYSAYEYEGRFFSGQAEGASASQPAIAEYTIDDSGVYYGAGIALVGMPAALTLQYVRYADKEHHSITAWQLGVVKYWVP